MEKRIIRLRKRSSGGGVCKGGDAVVTLTTHGEAKTPILCVTVRQVVMEKCRWRHGDRVLVDFETDATTGVFRMTRTEDRKNGYALSCSKGEKYGAVIKMTIDPEDVSAFFPGEHKAPLMCTLVRGDANMAEIAVDYSA